MLQFIITEEISLPVLAQQSDGLVTPLKVLTDHLNHKLNKKLDLQSLFGSCV